MYHQRQITTTENPPSRGLKLAVYSAFVVLIALAAYFGWQLHELSRKDKKIKLDFFTVNQIKYGLLSGDNWTSQVNVIIASKIDSFSLEGQNRKVLTSEINGILNRLFDEVDAVLHRKRDKLGEKIKFGVINAFVDVDNFRKEIPRFSRAIIDELDKSKNKDKLKALLKDKVTGILAATRQDTANEQLTVTRKYGFETKESFNRHVKKITDVIRSDEQKFGYSLIGVLAAVLLLWIVVIRHRALQASCFLLSVVISGISLFIGVSLPMIEIDARIATLDLSLMASHIRFYDQVIFYQAKSILDVIHILIVNGGADTVFVGFLILLFSVLFPTTKLVCITIYLFLRERSKKFVYFMAFKSGKWSMADVMVVAIFMSYVGFKSILDNQLSDITVHNDTVNVVTTNKTNLQTGFSIFVAFVLFNLALAEILMRITRGHRQQKHAAAAANGAEDGKPRNRRVPAPGQRG